MSFSSEGHLNPKDSPNYAPSAVRSEANFRANSTPQTRPVSPTSSRSNFDEMVQEAVHQSLRHSQEPEVAYQPDRSRVLFRVVGFAATIGVSAIVAFVFFAPVPNPETSASSKPAISEFRSVIASVAAAKIAPEESQTLLKKFVQWEKRH